MMPEIEVSDSLYRQIEDAAEDSDLEHTIWEMVYLFQRGNDPT